MAAGGTCLFPQAPFEPHPDALLPARPLVLWPYTDMSDPRFTWGRKVVRLCQDARRGPLKIGALIQQGFCAYANPNGLFVKKFPFGAGEYPDFGCNFETFTRHDMLECEALGNVVNLAPGEETVLPEWWKLLDPATPPNDEDACAEWLAKVAL